MISEVVLKSRVWSEIDFSVNVPCREMELISDLSSDSLSFWLLYLCYYILRFFIILCKIGVKAFCQDQVNVHLVYILGYSGDL